MPRSILSKDERLNKDVQPPEELGFEWRFSSTGWRRYKLPTEDQKKAKISRLQEMQDAKKLKLEKMDKSIEDECQKFTEMELKLQKLFERSTAANQVIENLENQEKPNVNNVQEPQARPSTPTNVNNVKENKCLEPSPNLPKVDMVNVPTPVTYVPKQVKRGRLMFVE